MNHRFWAVNDTFKLRTLDISFYVSFITCNTAYLDMYTCLSSDFDQQRIRSMRKRLHQRLWHSIDFLSTYMRKVPSCQIVPYHIFCQRKYTDTSMIFYHVGSGQWVETCTGGGFRSNWVQCQEFRFLYKLLDRRTDISIEPTFQSSLHDLTTNVLFSQRSRTNAVM